MHCTCMADRLTHDKVMIACVTREVTLIVQPAIDNNVDRVHLIHFVKKSSDKSDRSDLYQEFYDENERRLKENGIEVVEHSDAAVYNFRAMMAEIYSILLDEKKNMKSQVYVNLSGGTSEYTAAAAITSMMFEDVEIFTVGKSYEGMTENYEQIRESCMKDGRLVGSCVKISGTYNIDRFPIEVPDRNLLKAYKVYCTMADNGHKVSNTAVIRNLILKDIWMSRGDMEIGSVIKGTSVELEDPAKGYACPRSHEFEYARRQRGEAVQYFRNYVSEWLAKGWIRQINKTKRYMITPEGRNVLEIFCPSKVMAYDKDDIAVQVEKFCTD